jgi:uncharacterized membrane protein
MTKLQKKIIPAIVITGAINSGLGMVASMLIMGEQYSPESIERIIAYQNFSLGIGAASGFLVGAIAAISFMRLARKTKYPGSSSLGARLGAIAGAVVGLVTCVIIYAAADAFNFIPSTLSAILIDSIFIAFVLGIAGLAIGYLFAEIGGRNISYWC